MPLSKYLVLTSVLLVLPAPAQSPQPASSTSRKQISESDRKQADGKNGPTHATVSPVGTAQPSEASSGANTAATENKTKKPWWEHAFDYLRRAFAPANLSNWFLCIFAAIAAGIALRTLSAIRKQADIAQRSLRHLRQYVALTARLAKSAEDSFILTQRPKVIVRNVAVFGTDPEADLFQTPAGRPGEPIKGSIFIANTGTTEAQVISVGCEVFRHERPLIPPYAKSDGTVVDFKLPPGKGTEWPFETIPEEVPMSHWALLREHLAPVYVLGRIGYKDKLGTMRSTSFCRRWDVGIKRFRQLNPPDPDYEHAD